MGRGIKSRQSRSHKDSTLFRRQKGHPRSRLTPLMSLTKKSRRDQLSFDRFILLHLNSSTPSIPVDGGLEGSSLLKGSIPFTVVPPASTSLGEVDSGAGRTPSDIDHRLTPYHICGPVKLGCTLPVTVCHEGRPGPVGPEAVRTSC